MFASTRPKLYGVYRNYASEELNEMLAHYELAKPALKRAKDKAPKEERDVLFIERVVKMLKPGGRAAIVLPQRL